MTELKKRVDPVTAQPPAPTQVPDSVRASAPALPRRPMTLQEIRRSAKYREAIRTLETAPESSVLPEIPCHDPEISYLWMRIQLGGQDDDRNVAQTMNQAGISYEYVRPSELPEVAAVLGKRNMGEEPVLRVGDVVLVKTSIYLRQALLDIVEEEANAKLKRFKAEANKFSYGGKKALVEYEDNLTMLGADDL